MLRFTPLIALVSIVTVGCDQSPVDPLTADTEDTTALLSAQGATVTSVPVSGTTDLCGYDLVDYEGTFQVVVRQAIDETGTKRSHVLEPFQFRLRGVGQTTGEVWNGWIKSAYAANYIGEPAFDLEGDARAFNLVQQTKWVGRGQAPDFVSTFRGHLTINGNGELVLFRVDFDNACD
jgi:hypothetical protein